MSAGVNPARPSGIRTSSNPLREAGRRASKRCSCLPCLYPCLTGHLPLFERAGPGGATAAHYCQNDRLLHPCPRKDSTARTMKTKKRIFAPSQEKLATPPKPRKAAIRAMTRNTIAKRNMVRVSFKKIGVGWRSARRTRDCHSRYCKPQAPHLGTGFAAVHTGLSLSAPLARIRSQTSKR
jgi:hypothetical protein